MSATAYHTITGQDAIRAFLAQKRAKFDHSAKGKKVYKVGGSWGVVEGDRLELFTGACPC